MAKHESESTYICMDNMRISEKTFFVPLTFGGYLLTIVYKYFYFQKPRHLEIKREVPVKDIPVENGSSSSEQITLRPIGPGIHHTNIQQMGQRNNVQGMYRKIPKQDSVFMNSQNVTTVELPDRGFGDSVNRLRELPSDGVARYINTVQSTNQYNRDNDQVINFHDVKAREPVLAKKAIDRVDKKRKSNSDDSLDDLIESNIQYLESEIESGKLRRISDMQPTHFPVDSQKSSVRDIRVTSCENVPRTNNNSFQNEVKLRLQIPSVSVSQSQRSPTQRFDIRDSISQSSHYEGLSSGSSSSLTTPSDIHVMSQSYVFQNTVPIVERKYQSATHSPYLQRKPTELVEMEDLSKSDSQLSEHSFNYQRPSSYLNPQFLRYQTYGTQRPDDPHVYESSKIETIHKTLSAPVMENGMFSDVDYDIEVSERVKKWEKLMKKKNIVTSSEDGKSQVSLTTIVESDGGIPDDWKVEPEAPVPIPQTVSLTSASVTVTRTSPSFQENMKQQRPPSPVITKTYFEPKVQSSENSTHRIFRVVQDPRCCKAVAKPTESQFNWVQSPLLRENSPYDNHQYPEQFIEEESVLRPNITSKQGWPPSPSNIDDKVKKSSRLSKFEDELNELQDIKVQNVSDLRRKFDSDASGNESTDVTETPATPVRRTPLVQRKQFSQIPPQPQPPQVPEKRKRPPQPPVKVYERKVDKISIDPVSTTKQSDADVWSPKLESKKGLVSIERVTARTLQTIPFSEDPIWREIEEMTNIDKLLASEESEKDSYFNRPETRESSKSVESEMTHSSVPSTYLKRNSRIEVQTPTTRQTVTSSGTKIFAPSGEQQVVKTRPFITPKIQPLKLSVTTKSSIDALDEVLEDIRTSLQKRTPKSETASPLVSKQTNVQSFFPNESVDNHLNRGNKGVVSAAYTHYDPRSFRQSEEPPEKQSFSDPSLLSTSDVTNQNVPEFNDPAYTQYPHIVNGNYQLDPMLLKQKLLGTGLADASETESTKRIPPLPPERRYFPSQSDPTISSADPTISSAEEEVIRSMEELKKLAEDVETKLRQIKTKIIQSDEGKLDSIVTALRKFSPTVNPKFDPQKVESRAEHNTKKLKMQDALSELERIYESLDLNDENLLSRAERRETTLPRMSSHHDDAQKVGLKRTLSDSDYRYGAAGIPPASYSDSDFYDCARGDDNIDDIELETQKEFENINKSFETLLAEVSQPITNDVSSDYVQREEHIAEIDAALESFLGEFRKGNSNVNESAMNADELAERIKASNKSQTNASSYEVAKPNTCRDIIKSEVFTATSGPFSVLVGINGNDRRPRQKVKKFVKKSDPSKTQRSSSDTRKSSNTRAQSTRMCSVGVQHSSSNESGSKEESESESSPQIVRRPKRPTHWQHRKSMPADMLKKSVETQTMESNWVSPVSEIREKFQHINERANSVSSENSDAQGPRRKQIAKGIAMMMEFFSSSEDERSRRSKLSHSHSAPDLTELFRAESVRSEKVKSPTSNKPTTPRSVKQRHDRSRKKSAELQGKVSDEKTDEFSVTSATSDDGQKASSKPPRHPGLRKQKSFSPEKSDASKSDNVFDVKYETSNTEDIRSIVSDSEAKSTVVLRKKIFY